MRRDNLQGWQITLRTTGCRRIGAMSTFTTIFLFAVIAGLALQLWLAARQAAHIISHADTIAGGVRGRHFARTTPDGGALQHCPPGHRALGPGAGQRGAARLDRRRRHRMAG